MSQIHSGIRAVIFDISGTVLDYGSRGPVAAFVELFARHGVSVSAEDARRPMGTHKWDHIRAMLDVPEIGAQWKKANGSLPVLEKMNELYAEFTALQTEVLKKHCDVIPGVPEVTAELRRRGIKIANTTGYDTGMMVNLIPLAEQGGYVPDLWVCPDQVGKGLLGALDGVLCRAEAGHLPDERVHQGGRYAQRCGRSAGGRDVGCIGHADRQRSGLVAGGTRGVEPA